MSEEVATYEVDIPQDAHESIKGKITWGWLKAVLAARGVRDDDVLRSVRFRADSPGLGFRRTPDGIELVGLGALQTPVRQPVEPREGHAV